MPRQLKVAVTGSAGSGKSTVCRSLRDKGLAVIDLDSVSRETVKPGSPALEAVRSVFGSAALGPDGCLDRSYLRSLIISDSSQKKKLEDILHPLIISMMNEKMDDAFALGEQAEAFGHTGDQAFAHAQVGVFAGGEGDVSVAHEVGGLGGGQCHARR